MTTLGDPAPFTSQEAQAYWDQRHRDADDLASGGNITFSRADNEMFYAVRAARLVDVIGPEAPGVVPRRILDAGCGKGYFSRALARFGHRVDGIDTSETAIETCRSLASPMESYALSELATWRPPHLYDAVVVIDVVYHILDDEEWAASVRHLADLTTLGGRIAVVDHDRQEDVTWGRSQRTRSSARYHALFAESGVRYDRYLRNDFRDDPSGFHIGTKVT